jgi:hypothetical protein
MRTTNKNSDLVDHSILLEQALVQKTREYLTDKAIEAIEGDIATIAAEAVKKWYEVAIALQPNTGYGDTNIHVQLVNKVIRTEVRENPISITVTTKDQ